MEISGFLIEAITGPEVVVLVSLMAANVALSIIASMAKGVFNFPDLGKFVGTRVWPFIAYVVVAMLATAVSEWTAAAVAVFAGLVALYGSGINKAIKSLTGVSIPNIFTEKAKE